MSTIKRVRRTKNQIHIDEINEILENNSKLWAINRLERNPLFFDAETTGLGTRDQVIEMGGAVFGRRQQPCTLKCILHELSGWDRVTQHPGQAY